MFKEAQTDFLPGAAAQCRALLLAAEHHPCAAVLVGPRGRAGDWLSPPPPPAVAPALT